MKILLTIIITLMTSLYTDAQNFYAVSIYPTPVLNTADFESVFGGTDGKTVKTDEGGLIREMEYIAFEGTVFEVLNEIDKGSYKIFQVRTDDYNYNTDLYIDSRFAEIKKEKPGNEPKKIPSRKEIYDFLDKAVGAKYFWGGNYINGVSKMIEFYRPSGSISEETERLWTLKGCDCSGLMYEATKGYTERNTNKLLYFGDAVEIEGLTANQIAVKLKPLDMIVWDGHIIYVYDKNTAIQSSLSMGGVVKTDLLETIKDVMKTRKPVNDYDKGKRKRFVIRRWHEIN